MDFDSYPLLQLVEACGLVPQMPGEVSACHQASAEAGLSLAQLQRQGRGAQTLQSCQRVQSPQERMGTPLQSDSCALAGQCRARTPASSLVPLLSDSGVVAADQLRCRRVLSGSDDEATCSGCLLAPGHPFHAMPPDTTWYTLEGESLPSRCQGPGAPGAPSPWIETKLQSRPIQTPRSTGL